MWIDKLKSVFGLVDKINPTVKTFIIIGLVIIGVNINLRELTTVVMKQTVEAVTLDRKLAEDYAKKIAPKVTLELERIIQLDLNATNVLLLNYHNSKESSSGLSYNYITALAERTRGIGVKKCINFWRELEYMNYAEDMEQIHSAKYVRIDSISYCEKYFPDLASLLVVSGAKTAGFYSIQGVDEPLGVIVVMYKCNKEYEDDYYEDTLSPSLQRLSSLLDYNNIKKNFK